MKTIIIYFPIKDHQEKIINPYQGYELAESKQQALIASFSSCIVYIARGIQSHISKNTFIPQFKKENNIWIHNSSLVDADLVLGFEIPKSVTRIFNTMSGFSKDKTHFENIFPQYAIHSQVCRNYDEITKKFPNIQTSLKVLKPQFGSRSRGIFIQEPIPPENELHKENYPYLLQDFFDTSGGFYEFPGLHDFRIVMLDGNIIGKFLRQPEAGKYTANSFKRGGFIDLETWVLPQEIHKIIDDVEQYCAANFFHRYYSIDVGCGPDGTIKVFEINSAPGLTNKHISKKLGEYIVKNILKIP